jgi:hypothetical protein
MKRYLHIKFDASKLIWYQFSDECMIFNKKYELVNNDPIVYDRAGIYYSGIEGHINVNLDIFLKINHIKYYGMLLDLIEQAKTIENRYKKIKKILE